MQADKLEYTRDELDTALGVKPESIYTLVKRHVLAANGQSRFRRYPQATAAYLYAQLSRGKSVQTANLLPSRDQVLLSLAGPPPSHGG